MKIALPTNENKIDDHFGHCEYFTIFTVNDNKEITSKDIIKSPAGCGCKSNILHILSHMGVKLMLAGNIGEGAVNVLNSYGIQVLRGCSGDINMVTQKWLEGNLVDSGIICHEHESECHNS